MITVRSALPLGVRAAPVNVTAQLDRGHVGPHRFEGVSPQAEKHLLASVRASLRDLVVPWPSHRVIIKVAGEGLGERPGVVANRGAELGLALPAAVAVLALVGHVPAPSPDLVFVGGLSLSGRVEPVRGIVACALDVEGTLVCDKESALDVARLLGEARSPLYANSLGDVAGHLQGREARELCAPYFQPAPTDPSPVDLDDVLGQWRAKRALEVAAAGGHGALLVGPPGQGKAMLARRAVTLLPPVREKEREDVARAFSAIGGTGFYAVGRPHRAPHHTVSDAGMASELALAHRGVLFLDEVHEFRREGLDLVARARESGLVPPFAFLDHFRFGDVPSDCLLLAAAPPCPCGRFDDRTCACSLPPAGGTGTTPQGQHLRRLRSSVVARHLPLRVRVGRADRAEQRPSLPYDSASVRARVEAAQDRQVWARGKLNQRLTDAEVRVLVPAPGWGGKRAFFPPALEDGVPRVAVVVDTSERLPDLLRVARTIADLAGVDEVTDAHLDEALVLCGLTSIPSL